MNTELTKDDILKVQERLENSDLDTLLFLVSEITGEEYSKDYERLFYGYSVSDIVESVVYGDFYLNDDYFTIDNFGHLISFNKFELKDHLLNLHEREFLEYALDNPEMVPELFE